MIRFMLLTGAAALAVASAATAAPQQGKGNNKGSAKVERSQKQAKAGKENRRGEIRVARSNGRADVRVRQKNKANAKAWAKARGDERRAVRVDRVDRDDRRLSREQRRFDRDGRRFDGNNRGGAWANATANGWCPPGLRNKPLPGECMPPGQAKEFKGQSLRVLRSRLGDRIVLRELPTRLRVVYRDDDDHYYRFGNGYVYKVDRDNDVISALLPLFGLGVGLGQPFPAAYSNYMLPAGLQSFYPDSPFTTYRYANGYVYEIDPITGLVEDIDPALGYGYGYGQMMPATYSAYNVPYQYRPLYRDTNDYYYRYAPGSIYRVDAGSGLIDAVAALLMPGGLAVGQPLPMGYDTYNVPLAYRSQYYDTPQNMYRYSNGYIYQVDPTTRLVTAIISALT